MPPKHAFGIKGHSQNNTQADFVLLNCALFYLSIFDRHPPSEPSISQQYRYNGKETRVE